MGQVIRQAQPGDKVRIHYTGTLEDGTLFDTTYEIDDCEDDDCGCGESGPLELVIGAGEFFPGVESALVGMSVGDKKTVTLDADDAFGEYDDEQVMSLPRSEFPDDLDPKVGDTLELTDDDGEGLVVTVTDVADGEVILDANHPLAGEELTFEVELIGFI